MVPQAPGSEVPPVGLGDGVAWEELCTQLRTTHAPRMRPPWGAVACEPGWSWRPHLSDHDLWLVTAGSGQASINGQPVPLRRGTMMLLRPGDACVADQDPDDRLTVLYTHFDFGRPRRPGPASTWPELVAARVLSLTTSAPLERELATTVRLAEDPHPANRLEADLRLGLLVLAYYRSAAESRGRPVTSRDGRIEAVVERVRRDPGRRLRLDEAAAIAQLSPQHFSRLFRTEMNQSYRQFLVQTRLERARELLVETPMSISEIGAALGYPDVYLFSRQMKQHLGASPRAVRTAHRGVDPADEVGDDKVQQPHR